MGAGKTRRDSGEYAVEKTKVGGEKNSGRESRGSALEARREDEETDAEQGGSERGRSAAADGDKDEEDSLDERLPFMLESLKRVALTVQDLQGRCARISQGKVALLLPPAPLLLGP